MSFGGSHFIICSMVRPISGVPKTSGKPLNAWLWPISERYRVPHTYTIGYMSNFRPGREREIVQKYEWYFFNICILRYVRSHWDRLVFCLVAILVFSNDFTRYALYMQRFWWRRWCWRFAAWYRFETRMRWWSDRTSRRKIVKTKP